MAQEHVGWEAWGGRFNPNMVGLHASQFSQFCTALLQAIILNSHSTPSTLYDRLMVDCLCTHQQAFQGDLQRRKRHKHRGLQGRNHDYERVK